MPAHPWFTQWHSPKQRCANEKVRAIAGDYNILAYFNKSGAGKNVKQTGNLLANEKHA